MSSPQPLEIKVIYSASKRAARPRKAKRSVQRTAPPAVARPARAPQAASVAAAGTGRPWLLLALCNLAVVGGLYYGTWWVGDVFITFKIMMYTPIEGMDPHAIDQFFPGAAADSVNDLDLSPTAKDSATHFTGRTAAAVLSGAGFGWLTLSTISMCFLAIGAGSAFGKFTRSQLRRIAVIVVAGGALWLAYLTYSVLLEYGWGFKLFHSRIGVGGLVLWLALLGWAIDRGHVKWSRMGAYALILAAAGTPVAIYLGHLSGAIEEEWATPLVLVGAFVVHSLYGFILLPITARLRA